MTSDILLKFAKKGINLSPNAYKMIINSKDPKSLSSSLIIKLKSNEFTKDDLVSVNEDIIDKFINGDKDENIVNNSNETTSNRENKINTELKQEPINKLNTEILKQKPTVDNLNTEKTINEENLNSEIKPINESKSKINKLEYKDEEEKEFDASKIRENPGTDVETEKIADIKVENKDHNICRRNMEESHINYDFKILQDTSNKSYTSGEISNLISYFQSRFEKEEKILSHRPELKVHDKIENIGKDQTELALIVMVNDIRITKNGHILIEFEDDTGQISVLFSKDNTELFQEAQKIVRDEVVGIIATKNGSLAIANQIIHPGVPRMAKKDMDFGIVFLSDVHIGSKTFLPEAFEKFIMWLNCEYGNEEQIKIAKDVKYLIIGGDIVDGIGIYPNQEKELEIKDITQQYNKAASYLGQIRSDIKIIITPGNHDASRVAEPQPAVPEKYAKALYELNNVEFISNPGYVSLDGIKVLIYHGRSFDDMAMTVKGFSHERNDILMEELLKKRHLAPIYGERTPLASELEDYLVIDDVPDVFHTGHVHINTHRMFNGIHLINSGTFQTQTEFQKIKNIVPTPAEVPVLDKGVYKQLKFI
ncbi:DNA polymerase II [Methanobrevibacter sp. 87.7]|uniref:DNA-directed DNA polymerase II small subunit n=1 Tax=Methanobrevibacter sp. 87.7 TaxID=387957 RepID=UPI000B50B04B|nr:DNA-directed DNA polymerase II small subunit [Methanobrevibacter sp. 87.7]OWT33436.1 DNA polymerase II [Methanobrevibacter sp. 87.7]